MLLGSLAYAQQSFYDCKNELGSLLSDEASLEKIKKVHSAASHRFDSECLEMLLQKGFMLSSNYLIDEYYPSTMIDTEVIVNKVQENIRRSHNKLLYHLLEQTHGSDWPPVREPVLYYAQSREDVFIKLKWADDIDAPGCSHSFNKQVDINAGP